MRNRIPSKKYQQTEESSDGAKVWREEVFAEYVFAAGAFQKVLESGRRNQTMT